MKRMAVLFICVSLLLVGASSGAGACPETTDPGVQETSSPNLAGSQVSAGVHPDNRVVVHYRTGASYNAFEFGPSGVRAHGARTGAGNPDTELTRPGSWAYDLNASADPHACGGSPANGIVVRIP